MEEKTDAITIAGSSPRQRKFGLPDWMVSNIERLNFSTDFEQYACSPPDSEGLMSDFKDGLDISEIGGIVAEPKSVQKVNFKKDIQVNVESDKKPPKLIINRVDYPLHNAINNIKNEEFLSSPDSTPCATPEPSPVIRRKMSNPTDTVITNPGRWFYMGKVSSLQKKLKELEVKENCSKEEQFPSCSKTENIDTHLSSKKNGVKLRISNFDLNAVSPTSW